MRPSTPCFTAVTAALLMLSACATAPEVARSAPLGAALDPRPEDAVCLGRALTPAVIETVTEQVLVQPAVLTADEQVLEPARFRTVTRQRILKERGEVEFEVPCPDRMTTEFVASLQRALKVRGYYTGPITGRLDAPTGRATRDYQVARGDHDTPILTLASARALGLVAHDQPIPNFE